MSDGADSMGVAARVAPEPCVCVSGYSACSSSPERQSERETDQKPKFAILVTYSWCSVKLKKVCDGPSILARKEDDKHVH